MIHESQEKSIQQVEIWRGVGVVWGGESVRSSLVCAERPSRAWGLVREKILRALNWLDPGQAVWEKERGVGLKMWGLGRRKTEGVQELMANGVVGVEGCPSHMKVCGDECAIIRLISSLIYRSGGYQRLHIRRQARRLAPIGVSKTRLVPHHPHHHPGTKTRLFHRFLPQGPGLEEHVE